MFKTGDSLTGGGELVSESCVLLDGNLVYTVNFVGTLLEIITLVPLLCELLLEGCTLLLEVIANCVDLIAAGAQGLVLAGQLGTGSAELLPSSLKLAGILCELVV